MTLGTIRWFWRNPEHKKEKMQEELGDGRKLLTITNL